LSNSVSSEATSALRIGLSRLKEVAVFESDHDEKRVGLATSRNVRTVLTWTETGAFELWDLDDPSRSVTLEDDSEADAARAQLDFTPTVNMAAFSSDGGRVIAASQDHTARIWETTTGRRLETLRANDDVLFATFSPDGKLAAIA